jgi:putative ABC transport system substrate-binding protein
MHFRQWKRREFITLLGGAVAWPRATRATSLETNRENLAAFRRGLGQTGYIEEKNVTVEYQWAGGQNDRLPTLAAELVRRQVSVIVVLETTNGAPLSLEMPTSLLLRADEVIE